MIEGQRQILQILQPAEFRRDETFEFKKKHRQSTKQASTRLVERARARARARARVRVRVGLGLRLRTGLGVGVRVRSVREARLASQQPSKSRTKSME